MNITDPLPFRAGLQDYRRQADLLFDALTSGDDATAWRFKWEHPRFRGRSIADVRPADLVPADAQTVVAREYGFENWEDLEVFSKAVRIDDGIDRLERAVEAVVAGELGQLTSMLHEHPELIRERSARRHHATLLHYIAANGVEGFRQKTPANAVEITTCLLEAGAGVDALADMYDEKCTTLSLLVSSSPPAEAGLQGRLAETLLDYGAALDGPGSKRQSALMTALAFGFLGTAEVLARRGARLDDIAAFAGLGRADEAARLLPGADSMSKHVALALAAQHGHARVVKLLLDAGEDPNRYNPDRYHSHSTPLHQAVSSNHENVVRLLVEQGARLDMRDTIYDATPLEWADYLGKTAIAEYLRDLAPPKT